LIGGALALAGDLTMWFTAPSDSVPTRVGMKGDRLVVQTTL
jgi:hypothetical protein